MLVSPRMCVPASLVPMSSVFASEKLTSLGDPLDHRHAYTSSAANKQSGSWMVSLCAHQFTYTNVNRAIMYLLDRLSEDCLL